MTLADMLMQKVTPMRDWTPAKSELKRDKDEEPRRKYAQAKKLLPYLDEPISTRELSDETGIPYSTVYAYLVSLLEDGLVAEVKTKSRVVLWQRKADERQRRREAGQSLVQEWVHGDDVVRLRRYAAKLRKARW